MPTQSTMPARSVVPLLAMAIAIASAGCRGPQPPAGSAPQPQAAVTEQPDEVEHVDWTVSSTAFADGERIPTRHTGDGEDLSPPIEWTQPPGETRQLALICDDPDAPGGTWTHWVVYGLAADAGGLPEGIPPRDTVDKPGLKQGMNSWPELGYRGPAPPPGKPHRYQFTVYALDAPISLEPGATKQELVAAMQGHIIAQAMVEGTYSR